MREIGVRALQQNASAVVREAAAGEEIIITDRGRPVARLGPVGASRLDVLRADGRVRSRRRSMADLPPARTGGGLSAAVITARDDERS